MLFRDRKKSNTQTKTFAISWWVFFFIVYQHSSNRDPVKVHAYFERLHFLMPILEKPSFMSRYKQLMARRDDIDFIQDEAAFISAVFAVFACAARLVNDARLTTENPDDGGIGMVYYERYVSGRSINF